MLATDRAATFAAAVRMVYRVHSYAAIRRTNAQPARTTRLADCDVLVVKVADLSDCCAAVDVNFAHFARRHTDCCVNTLFSHELSRRARTANELPALADFEFDIVNHGADRNVFERQSVAGFDVGFGSRFDFIADL